jgi:hypothetical protein
MPVDKISEFVDRVVRFVNFFLKPCKNLLGLISEKLDKDIILIFEIKIDCTVSHTRFPGDL